jgi:hypothetical protein
MSEFSTAEEFRFLAVQCEAQAAGTHREQDDQFVRFLAANIFTLGGHAAIEFIAHLIAEVMAPSEPIPDVLRRTADALRASAERLEARGRAA